ncbi:MAG: sigma-54 dependent transcriptional regulator [Alphaproteobacteria bacterium]|nr:sigma-54 dependent transcriptional regulator [Alphaproteobacteria bacterium]
MGSTHKKILLVEDEPSQALTIGEHLRREGYDVVVEDTGRKAMSFVDHSVPAAVVLDLHLPDISGLEVLDHIHAHHPHLPVIVMTADNSMDMALQATLRGAYDFVVKPCPPVRLNLTLANALERKALAAEISKLRRITGLERFHNFAGRSNVMQAVYRIIDSVASSQASVFIRGENGAGKEMAAQTIHDAGPRRNKPFIILNCATIPHELLESAIFGHVKGAFPGAVSDQPGAAKQADGGTLFLEEVCDMPLEMQTKFLRFMQTGEVLPVGGNKVDFVDVRIISATTRDPLEETKERRFREDLFYRLHVVPLDIPPLREREDDVLMLAGHFLSRFGVEENKHFIGLSPEIISLFRRYDWPGNVRQLENVIRNVVVLNDGPMVTEAMLPKDLKRFADENQMAAANRNRHDLMLCDEAATPASVKPLWQVEREAITQAMEFAQQDMKRAAALLEISPSTLYRKLQISRDPEGAQMIQFPA